MSSARTLVALALFAGASSTLGRLALVRLPSPELRRYERTALELTAGLGLTALLLSISALAHALGLGLFLLVPLCYPHLRRRRSPPSLAAGTEVTDGDGGGGGVAVWICVLVACVGAIAPVTDEDALAYVVPIARHIARTGSLQVWSDQARSMWPLSHHVLLAGIVTLGGDRLAALSAFEWLLAVGAVSALARRVCRRTDHVPLAVALAIASPVVAFQVSAAKEDLWVAAATAAAAFCLCGAGTIPELAAAGLFAGVAAGAKYPGLGVALAVVAYVALTVREQRARAIATTAGCAAVVGGLWYGLNVWRYGNPVAPLIWGASGTTIDAATSREFVRSFGGDRSLFAFLTTPVRLFVDPSPYCGRAALFNPLTLVAALGVFAPSQRRRYGALLFLSAVLYTGWFLTLQNARLLLPASMLLAPAAADCLASLTATRRLMRALLAGSMAAGLLLVAAVGVVRASRAVRYRSAFLERDSPRFADIQWANAHLDPDRHRIGSVPRAIGYLKIPAIVLDPNYQLELSASELDDPQRFLAACRRQGITHLFAAPDTYPTLSTHLQLVYANERSRLGGVRFFREPPAAPTAIFEIMR